MRLRRALIEWLGDVTCSMPIHDRMLRINLAHDLPVYQARHPYYDTLPRRLGAFVRDHRGALTCLDVGANIGDSVAAFMGSSQDRFLAVEPSPKFFRMLQANWADDVRVTPIEVMCSSGNQSAEFSIRERNGTASIVETQTGATMKRQLLDEVLAEHPAFIGANVIKVDTDGHDFEVLVGAAKTIAANRPAVLWECDVFARADYTEGVLRTLALFKNSGYRNYLVYDNFGYLVGSYSLDDDSAIKSLLFYQLTSELQYFDLLFMTEPELGEFHHAETRFFTNERVCPSLRETALLAGGIDSQPRISRMSTSPDE
jgi:FkbM family methyltransferase